MKMARDCIPQTLSNAFYHYGKFVARKPLYFLIIPVVAALLVTLGVIRIELTTDIEYLYTPLNGPAKDERDFFEKSFSSNTETAFTPLRSLTFFDGFLLVHLQNKKQKNILADNALQSILDLHDFIIGHQVKINGDRYVYEDLCASFKGQCFYPGTLQILGNATSFQDVNITFPSTQLADGRFVNLVQELGRVTLDSNSNVISARALQLAYFVAYTENNKKKETAWLQALRDELQDYTDPEIEVSFQISSSMEEELEKIIPLVMPRFAIAFVVLGVFAVITCMMTDWVRSKPWIAIAGLTAAGLGIITAYGILIGTGVGFASVCVIMPFLVIGIGIDDMFIMISAWRYTSVMCSVEERLGRTLQSAAVSITITTLTDCVAFGVGCLTSFQSVTLFCAYSGVATLFVYIYTLTFTAACMVFSGQREAANEHPMNCKRVLPKDEAGDESRMYQLFCASGMAENAEDWEHKEREDHVSAYYTPDNLANGHHQFTKGEFSGFNGTEHTAGYPNGTAKMQEYTAQNPNDVKRNVSVASKDEAKDIRLPYLNIFFETHYANFILSIPMRVVITISYLALIAGAIYGITVMDQGLELENLVSDDSYYRTNIQNVVRDFEEHYGPVLMIGFDEKLNYSDPSVRDEINAIVRKLRKSKYFIDDDRFMLSWLDNFDTYRFIFGQDATLHEFLQHPSFEHHVLDITFDSDNTTITSSRIFLQTSSLSDAVDQVDMLLLARDVAKKSDLNVVVYTPRAIMFDQYAIIQDTVLLNLGVAVASMMVISIIFIPSISTVIWVTLATLSICVCCVGYMSLWGVSLDSISLVNLVMNIGFSVDFAAHISYHFVISPANSPREKAKETLGALGTPIFQGAASTVLGVLALSTSGSYISRTFFKLVFLVMSFGFFHGMLLMPVLLTTIESLRCKWCKKDKETTNESRVSVNATNKHNDVAPENAYATIVRVSQQDADIVNVRGEQVLERHNHAFSPDNNHQNQMY